MIDGIYLITFRGITDWGMGMLIFDNKKVTGADAGGALYDGTYSTSGNNIKLELVLTVPPGTVLVQGVGPWSTTQKIPFSADVPISSLSDNSPVRVDLPVGPVNVILKHLRNLQ